MLNVKRCIGGSGEDHLAEKIGKFIPLKLKSRGSLFH
jgi:hypothetical protein